MRLRLLKVPPNFIQLLLRRLATLLQCLQGSRRFSEMQTCCGLANSCSVQMRRDSFRGQLIQEGMPRRPLTRVIQGVQGPFAGANSAWILSLVQQAFSFMSPSLPFHVPWFSLHFWFVSPAGALHFPSVSLAFSVCLAASFPPTGFPLDFPFMSRSFSLHFPCISPSFPDMSVHFPRKEAKFYGGARRTCRGKKIVSYSCFCCHG